MYFFKREYTSTGIIKEMFFDMIRKRDFFIKATLVCLENGFFLINE
jgi:hypothetical protein